jgi:hypothetical protein
LRALIVFLYMRCHLGALHVTGAYDITRVMLYLYTQTRGGPPGIPGSSASTISACLVIRFSESIGCALAQIAFALLPSSNDGQT